MLEQALAHRPSNRFQTAREFAGALDDVALQRSLRLDDCAVLPYLHSLGVLPSSSGTRPVVTEAAPVSRRETPSSRRKPPPLPSSPASAPPTTLRAAPYAVARANAPVVPPVSAAAPSAKRSMPRLPLPPSSRMRAPAIARIDGDVASKGSPEQSTVPVPSSRDVVLTSGPPPSAPVVPVARAAMAPPPRPSAPAEQLAPSSVPELPIPSAAPPSSERASTPGLPADVRPTHAPRASRSSGAYRVRTRSGGVVGPLPRAEMLALLATGRLSAKSHVSIKTDAFIQVGTVPALSALAAHPAYRFRDDDAVSPEWLQRIDAVCVPTVLFRIAKEKRTGLFLAVDGRRRKRVFFDKGDPVFVASTDRDELLGRRLVAAGIVPEKAVEVALGSHPLRLGEGLVSLGALGAAQLVRELSRQLEERLIELGAWRNGELRFFDDVTLDQGHHIRTREPTLKLLTELVREQYAPGDIAALLRPITKDVLIPSADRDSLALELGQSPADVAVLGLADGSRTVRDIVTSATQSGIPMADALRAVLVGLCSGCLTCPTWRVSQD